MSVLPLQNGFGLNTKKITKFAEALTQQEALFRPYDKVNSFIWNLGHITMVRNTLIKILNPTEKLDVYPTEKELFGKGAALQANENYPDLTFLIEQFVKRGERINELVMEVSDEHLAAECFVKIGPMPLTNEQIIYFFYNHECEHLGELKVNKNIAIRLRENV